MAPSLSLLNKMKRQHVDRSPVFLDSIHWPFPSASATAAHVVRDGGSRGAAALRKAWSSGARSLDCRYEFKNKGISSFF